MTTKKTTWDIILKVIIAVASAIAGALGANAMNLQKIEFNLPFGRFIKMIMDLPDNIILI